MSFGESYACGHRTQEKLDRLTAKEHTSPTNGTWYEVIKAKSADVPPEKGLARYAFHPLGKDRYIISVDNEEYDNQTVLVAKISGDTIDVVVPTAPVYKKLIKKHNLTDDLKTGLAGQEDDRHRFFLDIAAAPESDVEIIHRCRKFF